jgi:UDPglucose--hexose-1-phosphate uridylyltransferase
MFRRSLRKPDGRHLWLYAAAAMPPEVDAPAPTATVSSGGHLRWHPLRAEWVAYAAHRQQRTFLPPPAYNPLAPTRDPAAPTELPAGAYDVAVFENLFPTLTAAPPAPPATIVPTAPASGACEVVVFTQDPAASLGTLPDWHLALIVEVWADRTAALGARDDVQYVMPFENRGVEVGVTLHHPHGQIYAYPFVPPIAAREAAAAREHLAAQGGSLLAALLAGERADGRRLLIDDPLVQAWVPAWARFPYEVWIAPRRSVAALPDLDGRERAAFGAAIGRVVRTYDALWARPFPYVMVVHQAATDGQPHPEAHLHVEFYPAYRMQGRLKYLAGSELGAGVFTADTEPEAVAAELRAVLATTHA